MKLIRHGSLNKEKPGVAIDTIYYDVSAFGEDYNEQFFETNGLQRLEKFITGNKNNLKILAFVNFVGTSSTTHVIVNAQESKVYEIKNWD